MPIKYENKSYTFAALVRLIMKRKGWSKERASRYVGVIQAKQEKKKK